MYLRRPRSPYDPPFMLEGFSTYVDRAPLPLALTTPLPTSPSGEVPADPYHLGTRVWDELAARQRLDGDSKQ